MEPRLAQGPEDGEDFDLRFDDGDGAEEPAANRTAQGVGTPDFLDQFAPGAAAAFGAGGRSVSLPAGAGGVLLAQTAAAIAVPAVVADLRDALGRDLGQQCGDELRGGEDFEVALGFPVLAGTVDDGISNPFLPLSASSARQ